MAFEVLRAVNTNIALDLLYSKIEAQLKTYN
jgi:hypothetical protein